jgi:rhodanese-related sulfurtransferase
VLNPAREIRSEQEQEQQQQQAIQQKEGGKDQQVQGQQGKDMIFYCKAGVRARAAAQLAVQAGYDPKRIGVYDGSWLDWVDKGGKVERWEGDE